MFLNSYANKNWTCFFRYTWKILGLKTMKPILIILFNKIDGDYFVQNCLVLCVIKFVYSNRLIQSLKNIKVWMSGSTYLFCPGWYFIPSGLDDCNPVFDNRGTIRVCLLQDSLSQCNGLILLILFLSHLTHEPGIYWLITNTKK